MNLLRVSANLLCRRSLNSFLPVRFSFNKASEINQPEVKKIRNLKRLFTFGLFGTTLIAALILKKKKQRLWGNILAQSKRYHDKFGDLVLYDYKSYTIAEPILRSIESIQNFKFRENDVLLISFPKTGTTWLQEIVYLIQSDLNYVEAKEKNIGDRFPFIEFPSPGISTIEKMKSPRLVKTHLPPSIMFAKEDEDQSRSKPKVVAILRDPKDVLVSYYYFSLMNLMIGFKGTFDEFFDAFLKDEVPYGSIWRHYSEVTTLGSDPAWQNRVLIVNYEDLKANFAREIERICDFLGKERLSGNALKRLEEHCSFREMSANRSVNYEHWDEMCFRDPKGAKFMRKGIVGDWKAHFTKEQEVSFNKWAEENFNKN